METIKYKKQWVAPEFSSEGLMKTNSGSNTTNLESTTSVSAVTFYAPLS